MKKTIIAFTTFLRTFADELDGVAGSPEQAAAVPAEQPAPKRAGRPPKQQPATAVAEPQQSANPLVEKHEQVQPSGEAAKQLTYEELRALCMPMIKNPPHNEVVKTTIREFIAGDGGLKVLAEKPEHHAAFAEKIMAYRNENNLHTPTT